MVNEDILTAVLRNEAEPLCIVEPFNRALRHCYNLLKREPEGPGGKPPAVVAGLKAPKKAAWISASSGQISSRMKGMYRVLHAIRSCLGKVLSISGRTDGRSVKIQFKLRPAVRRSA